MAFCHGPNRQVNPVPENGEEIQYWGNFPRQIWWLNAERKVGWLKTSQKKITEDKQLRR
jgi:hypothetical protein